MQHRSTYDKLWQAVSYHVATDLPNKLGWTAEWSRIAPGLYLSKIPLRGDEQKITEFVENNGDPPVGLIVSVVQPAEIKEKCYSMDPVRPEEWKERQIEHKNLVMVDCRAEVDIQEAAETVLDIQENHRLKNQSVLIHCKAGKSRSAMITCCVLVLFDLQVAENKDKSVEELVELAANFVKKHRDQVNISKALKKTAVEVVKKARILLHKKNSSSSAISLQERIDICFANPEIKEEIKHMEIYSSLIEYRDGVINHWKALRFSKPKRAEHIDKLFNEIEEAKDSTWYANLVKMEGPVKDLFDASPTINVSDADEDKIKREKLIEKLKNDIESLICLNLDCRKAEFREIFPKEDEKLILRI